MNWSVLGGFGLLVLWVVLALVIALPTGWVHLPLAAGAVLIARGIVLADTST